MTCLKSLDKTTCGLASTVKLSTPTMETIADWGVQPVDLGNGLNQQMVTPFFQAYEEVRKSKDDGRLPQIDELCLWKK